MKISASIAVAVFSLLSLAPQAKAAKTGLERGVLELPPITAPLSPVTHEDLAFYAQSNAVIFPVLRDFAAYVDHASSFADRLLGDHARAGAILTTFTTQITQGQRPGPMYFGRVDVAAHLLSRIRATGFSEADLQRYLDVGRKIFDGKK